MRDVQPRRRDQGVGVVVSAGRVDRREGSVGVPDERNLVVGVMRGIVVLP